MSATGEGQEQARMTTWVIRGGERNRLVDEFVAHGDTGLGFPTVPDGSELDHQEVLECLEGYADPRGHASRFWKFLHEVELGDVVCMPDTPRRDVVVGEVTGPYRYDEHREQERYRHRRSVDWWGRLSIEELPDGHAGLYRLQAALTRVSDDAELVALAQAVRDGDRGRAPDDHVAGRPPSHRDGRQETSSERVCEVCGMLKPRSQFESGGRVCVDCR